MVRNEKKSNAEFYFKSGLMASLAVSGFNNAALAANKVNDKPNVLIIQTDEHNFRTLGCYRQLLSNSMANMWGPGVTVETPNIDSLAHHGVIFDKFYASSPVSTPSRGSFLTGRYPQNNGAAQNDMPMSSGIGTFATVLGANGYKTGYFGKWHLAGASKPGWNPAINGDFDSTKYMWNRGHWKWLDENAAGPYVAGASESDWNLANSPDLFTTDFITIRTINFIKANKDKPFLAYLSIPDPHGADVVRAPYNDMYTSLNWQAPFTWNKSTAGVPSWAAKETASNINRNDYFGMVKCIDDNLGKLLNVLKTEGILDNTVIIFTSDHGDMLGEHHRQNKSVPLEASCKVPFIVYYPSQIPEGKVVNNALNTTDFAPTLLSFLGCSVPTDMEGRDFSNLLVNPDRQADFGDITFSRSAGDASWLAAITSRYKLVVGANDEPWLLDLKVDPYELTNYFNDPAYQEVVKTLATELQNYCIKYKEPWYSSRKIATDLGKITGILPPNTDPVATAPEGDGSRANPYKIASLENLYWMAVQVDKFGRTFADTCFVQTKDIDASATSQWIGSYGAVSGCTGDGFLPIGIKVNSTAAYTFNGNYDGQNHAISGLYTSCSNTSNVQGVGLFGAVDGNDTIQNVRLVNPDITHKAQRVGALIGLRHTVASGTTTILNCSVTGGTVTGTYNNGVGAGAFIGITGNPLTMKNCYSSCNISLGSANTGGGVIGMINGVSTPNTVTLENCYSSGPITGASTIGGLIGNSNKAANVITINNCYVSGKVTRSTGTATTFGAFVGAKSAGTLTVNDGFYNNDSIDSSFMAVSSTDYAGVAGKTTSDMQTQSTYANWDFATTWGIASGFKGGYPYLTYFTPMATAATGVTATGFTANWAAVTGATGYELDVATDAEFTNMVIESAGVSGTSQEVSGLAADMRYYYRVRSVNNVTSENSNVIAAATSIATAFSASSDNQVTVIVGSGSLRVENAESYTVYNIAGLKVADIIRNTSSTAVRLNKGVYFVKTNNNTQEVIVK